MAAIGAGDFGVLDVENLVEEFEGLIKRDQRELGSQLRRIMTALLEQPARTRGLQLREADRDQP